MAAPAAHSGRVQPSTRRGFRELVGSLSRFAIVGTTTTGLYLGLYVLAVQLMPALVANLLAMVLSTLVSTEWHRSWTFHSDRSGLRTHLQAGLVTTLTYLLTSGALLALERWSPGAGEIAQVAALVAATTTAGLIRFTALRVWVFARPRHRHDGPPSPHTVAAYTDPATPRHRVQNVRPGRSREIAAPEYTASPGAEHTRS